MKKKSVCKIDSFGTKMWWLNNKLHREEDLPAIEFFSGAKHWCLDGKLHRINGPAIEMATGNKLWYLDGEHINCRTQEEFEHYLKYRVFL